MICLVDNAIQLLNSWGLITSFISFPCRRLACEQAKRVSRERCPSQLCHLLMHSHETRFTRPQRRACSLASRHSKGSSHIPGPRTLRGLHDKPIERLRGRTIIHKSPNIRKFPTIRLCREGQRILNKRKIRPFTILEQQIT